MSLVFQSPFKKQARELALFSERCPVGTSLWLPGAKMIDVMESLRRGLTNKQSLHILVERDAEDLRKIRARARHHLENVHLHGAQLEELNLRSVLKRRKLEYAWLDLCGNLRKGDVLWLEDELSPCLAQKATVAITVCQNTRGNRLVSRAWEILDATGNHFLNKAHQMLMASKTLNAYPAAETGYDPAFGEYSVPNIAHQGLQFSRRFHASSILPTAILLAAMPMWDFRVRTCFEYPSEKTYENGKGNGGHMVLIVCDSFQPRKTSRRDSEFEEAYQRLVGRKAWRPKETSLTCSIIQSYFRGPRKWAWGKKRMTDEAYTQGERAAITRRINRLATLVGLPPFAG